MGLGGGLNLILLGLVMVIVPDFIGKITLVVISVTACAKVSEYPLQE